MLTITEVQWKLQLSYEKSLGKSIVFLSLILDFGLQKGELLPRTQSHQSDGKILKAGEQVAELIISKQERNKMKRLQLRSLRGKINLAGIRADVSPRAGEGARNSQLSSHQQPSLVRCDREAQQKQDKRSDFAQQRVWHYKAIEKWAEK